jgi:hypothetical protein
MGWWRFTSSSILARNDKYALMQRPTMAPARDVPGNNPGSAERGTWVGFTRRSQFSSLAHLFKKIVRHQPKGLAID